MYLARQYKMPNPSKKRVKKEKIICQIVRISEVCYQNDDKVGETADPENP